MKKKYINHLIMPIIVIIFTTAFAVLSSTDLINNIYEIIGSKPEEHESEINEIKGKFFIISIFTSAFPLGVGQAYYNYNYNKCKPLKK